MLKPFFSPQRYFQKRQEVISPLTNKKGPKEWIIARSLCHYRLFSLIDIPSARRESVLQLKIKQWSPFANYGTYIAWYREQAAVWLWNKNQQQAAFEEINVKKATVFPESVLYARPQTKGVRLLVCVEGVEGQVWRDNRLEGSRWWTKIPNSREWVTFQRAYSLAPDVIVPEIIESDLLAKPWIKPRGMIGQLGVQQEKLWVILGLVAFVTIIAWQGTAISQWKQATQQIQAKIDTLTEDIHPILTARNQAIKTKQLSEQLFALMTNPSQLALVTRVIEKLPKNDAKLVEWSYRVEELRFAVESTQLDPIFYVQTFRADPLFQEVEAKTGSGRRAKYMYVSLKIAQPKS